MPQKSGRGGERMATLVQLHKGRNAPGITIAIVKKLPSEGEECTENVKTMEQEGKLLAQLFFDNLPLWTKEVFVKRLLSRLAKDDRNLFDVLTKEVDYYR